MEFVCYSKIEIYYYWKQGDTNAGGRRSHKNCLIQRAAGKWDTGLSVPGHTADGKAMT